MKFFKLLAVTFLPFVVSSSPTTHSQKPLIPGTTSHYAHVRGHTYHYLESAAIGPSKGTILLLHGLPDFSYGWRHQIPFLSALGYRVIAPDMLGFAETDSPCEVSNWAFKQLSADMAGLLAQIAPKQTVILGGHDWGAGLAYKLAMWHPQLFKGFFTVAIPYLPPWLGLYPEWADLSVYVENGTFPTLGYQLQWRDPAADRNFTTAVQVRQLLNTLFGGLTPDGQSALNPSTGLLYDLMPQLGPNPLVNGTEMDLYVETLLKRGIRGPFNYYRVRRMDWEDELPLARANNFTYQMPVLFMPALQDPSMLPRYYANMGQYFEDLQIRPVNGSHWALWDGRDQVNSILKTWIESLG